MRKQFVKTVEEILTNDKKTVLLLGDIGVFGFKKSFEAFPDRVYNIGILEQATISVASGLSLVGLIPIIHTIAPFITERCFEQIKNDFAYQGLGGNIVSVGASYDYASLGCTHHCPADVGILMNIPEIQIIVPGTSEEFNTLFNQSYKTNKLKYFRLSERENQVSQPIEFGRANVIKRGSLGTIIVVGPMLDKILPLTQDLDVTIIYLTTVRPFDAETIQNNLSGDKVLICEPYYSGALTSEVMNCSSRPLKIEFLGIPKKFLNDYGTAEQHDETLGFTSTEIAKKINSLFYE